LASKIGIFVGEIDKALGKLYCRLLRALEAY